MFTKNYKKLEDVFSHESSGASIVFLAIAHAAGLDDGVVGSKAVESTILSLIKDRVALRDKALSDARSQFFLLSVAGMSEPPQSYAALNAYGVVLKPSVVEAAFKRITAFLNEVIKEVIKARRLLSYKAARSKLGESFRSVQEPLDIFEVLLQSESVAFADVYPSIGMFITVMRRNCRQLLQFEADAFTARPNVIDVQGHSVLSKFTIDELVAVTRGIASGMRNDELTAKPADFSLLASLMADFIKNDSETQPANEAELVLLPMVAFLLSGANPTWATAKAKFKRIVSSPYYVLNIGMTPTQKMLDFLIQDGVGPIVEAVVLRPHEFCSAFPVLAALLSHACNGDGLRMVDIHEVAKTFKALDALVLSKKLNHIVGVSSEELQTHREGMEYFLSLNRYVDSIWPSFDWLRFIRTDVNTAPSHWALSPFLAALRQVLSSDKAESQRILTHDILRALGTELVIEGLPAEVYPSVFDVVGEAVVAQRGLQQQDFKDAVITLLNFGSDGMPAPPMLIAQLMFSSSSAFVQALSQRLPALARGMHTIVEPGRRIIAQAIVNQMATISTTFGSATRGRPLEEIPQLIEAVVAILSTMMSAKGTVKWSSALNFGRILLLLSSRQMCSFPGSPSYVKLSNEVAGASNDFSDPMFVRPLLPFLQLIFATVGCSNVGLRSQPGGEQSLEGFINAVISVVEQTALSMKEHATSVKQSAAEAISRAVDQFGERLARHNEHMYSMEVKGLPFLADTAILQAFYFDMQAIYNFAAYKDVNTGGMDEVSIRDEIREDSRGVKRAGGTGAEQRGGAGKARRTDVKAATGLNAGQSKRRGGAVQITMDDPAVARFRQRKICLKDLSVDGCTYKRCHFQHLATADLGASVKSDMSEHVKKAFPQGFYVRSRAGSAKHGERDF